MHVPFIVAGPGIPHQRSKALVYLMDLLPTFAEWAGVPIPAGVEGSSLVEVIQGRKRNVRDVLYTGYRDGQRAIRDSRWKLYRYPLVDRTQLFDLEEDPHELNNVADDPRYTVKRAELTEKLKVEMARYGDPTPLVVANPAPAEWAPPPRKPW